MNDYETGMAGMRDALKTHDALLNAFSRKLYAEQFKDYYMSLIPAMDAIENLYAAVVEKDTMLENMAQELVSSASQMLDAAPRREKERLNINLSLAMAGYVFPALLKYQGLSSKPLVDHVSKAWKRAFPKSNLTPAEYDVIEKGFHKKFCFITTACCRRLNRPDDCYELTLLRTYRDQYMAFLPDGEKLIEMYYDVAPSIVKHIDRLQDADRIYDGIWDTYIQPCIRLIESGKNEECRALYTRMVLDLKSRYFLTEPVRACQSPKIA
ncbi:CFI-box-CTERM domain-containing protein [Porcincola intestinalis]|uniref:CFI-box-CTERM domain-containing protein n=1 Tax=Porcincola intestinalis TaxID=2606632 RepID=UPI002A90B74A|nr:CFI-box-CTERM domain-containing protein [Porcincola intestinalis]MDY5578773.1 CFI-box-CTERM domain-containing protein [Porcincola intestinalis]